MNRFFPSAMGLLAGALLAWPLLSQGAEPAQAQNGMLVDSQGMTLYTYDKDSAGTSNCNGSCAQNWPPLAAPADATAEGAWSLVKRADGSLQWAHDGKPLYTFVMDKKPGDMLGDGKLGVWHMAQP